MWKGSIRAGWSAGWGPDPGMGSGIPGLIHRVIQAIGPFTHGVRPPSCIPLYTGVYPMGCIP